jgi:hypothetical protein
MIAFLRYRGWVSGVFARFMYANAQSCIRTHRASSAADAGSIRSLRAFDDDQIDRSDKVFANGLAWNAREQS